MNAKKRKVKLAAWIMLSSLIATVQLQADDTAMNISIAKFVSNLKVSGDIRLRQENFWKSTKGQRDRSRQRFRFRLGVQPQIQDVTVGFRLASGTGEQVSTNQSFDDLSSQKALFIDHAYVQWKAFEWFKLTGGRMPNPFWRTYSSDVVWDDDFNPEGFAQQLEYKFHERISAFANLSQVVLDEDSSDTRDQWLFGYQIGARTKWFQETKWDFGIALYDVDNERVGTFSQSAVQEGNSRFTGSGVSTVTAFFTMVHLTSEFKARVGPFPLRLHADYVNNIADNSLGAIGTRNQIIGSSGTEKVGYQFGAILGKAGNAMTWEVAYFFKWLETNATLADLADSDFGDGGTNRRGHIAWVAFNPREYLQLKAKFFVTEVLRYNLAPGPDNINRFQFDMSVKF